VGQSWVRASLRGDATRTAWRKLRGVDGMSRVGICLALGCRAESTDASCCHPPAYLRLSFVARGPADARVYACARRPVRSGKGLKAAVNRVREVWRGSSFNMETSLDTSPQAAPGQVQDIHPDLIARNMNLAPPPADNQV
jgi:hypothetical protein